MKKILISLAFLLIAAVFNLANCQTLDKTVDVGGAAMYPTKNIVENAIIYIMLFTANLDYRYYLYGAIYCNNYC